MSVTLVITNLTSSKVSLNDLYTVLDVAGTTGAALTITRSAKQVDGMESLKALRDAGTVSVLLTNSSDNSDLLSVPTEQHGKVTDLDVASAAIVTSDVVFDTPFAAAPAIDVNIERDLATSFKGQVYAQAVTASGFTIALDVTTAETGAYTTENNTLTPAEVSRIAVTAENPTWSPAENGVLLGAFTATLAQAPLDSSTITIAWLESTVAKTATIAGTTTLGGANAANVSAALLNRTTGALSVTFAGGHPPDTNSLTVTYVKEGELGPMTSTLAHVPVTATAITVHWLEATVAKSATITGTSTIGGSDAANLSAATLNRTTGALSLTFLTSHAPDINSVTVDYAQTRLANVAWVATY